MKYFGFFFAISAIFYATMGNTQSADVVACRDDNTVPSSMNLKEVGRCHAVLLNYAVARGYISQNTRTDPQAYKIKSGAAMAKDYLCTGGGLIGGGGVLGQGGQVAYCECKNVRKNPSRHFFGPLYKVTSSPLSPAGEALLGRPVSIFTVVERMDIPKHCPIHGSDSQVRNRIARTMSGGTYVCTDWGGSKECGAKQSSLSFRRVIHAEYQAESLPLLRQMLRNE